MDVATHTTQILLHRTQGLTTQVTAMDLGEGTSGSTFNQNRPRTRHRVDKDIMGRGIGQCDHCGSQCRPQTRRQVACLTPLPHLRIREA